VLSGAAGVFAMQREQLTEKMTGVDIEHVIMFYPRYAVSAVLSF
jgi:hypothetical protein